MGVFSFLFKKKNSDDHIIRINNSLKSSFSNIKEDMLHVHKSLSSHTENTSKRFQDIEERVKRMEKVLSALNYQSTKITKEEPIIIAPVQIKEESYELEEVKDILSVLNGIPKAELKLFKTIHDLQLSLNAKHISYKSLASYLYPGKEYNSIRSTITQFVIRLHTEGLVEKQRIGKETYVCISSHGNRLLKDARIKKIIKDIEIKE